MTRRVADHIVETDAAFNRLAATNPTVHAFLHMERYDRIPHETTMQAITLALANQCDSLIKTVATLTANHMRSDRDA